MNPKLKRRDINDLHVCEAYRRKREVYSDMKFADEILAEFTGAPIKVARAAMERACDRGYVEYGTSLRSGWITEKGLRLLKPAASNEEIVQFLKMPPIDDSLANAMQVCFDAMESRQSLPDRLYDGAAFGSGNEAR